MWRTIMLLCIFFTASTLTASNITDDKRYKSGKGLYFANGCGNCHGTNAEGSSYYPKLANKKYDFLVNKLQQFQKGIATTQKQEIMFTFANALSKQDVYDISFYLSHFVMDNPDDYKIQEDLLGVDY